jgi:hypothetical protein
MPHKENFEFKIGQNEIQRKKIVLSKAEEVTHFLINEMTPYYRLSYNDIVLFENLLRDFKKYNLLSSKEFNNFLSALNNTFRETNKPINFLRENNEFLSKIKNLLESNYKLGNFHYRQTSAYTCSIACYMMAMNIYKKSFRPNKKSEIMLYSKLKEPDSSTVELSSLIKDALINNFYTKIYSQFNYRQKKFDNPILEKRRLKYVEIMEKNKNSPFLQEHTEVEIGPPLFKALLKNGEAILINGTTAENFLHMRLICGYKGDNFIISDPLAYRKEEYTPSQLEKISNPPLGKWCFTISNKNFNFYQYPN